MKVDPSNYDYVMYVDASGDDGFQFDNGSTSCYVAAAFLVRQEDIQFNLGILRQIKHIVGCKDHDEVKYSKVRRNRRGPEALRLLRSLKGNMSCYVIFKKELADADLPRDGSKTLSVVCHLMALRSLDYYSFRENERVLISIDRMKKAEEVPLELQMTRGKLSDRAHPKRTFSSEIIFRDSKDANFLLIQIADLLCGTIREHFEQYESNTDMLYFKQRCPNCKKLMIMKGNRVHSMCKNDKSRKYRIVNSKNLHNVIQLLPDTSISKTVDFFFMKPTKMMDQHFYLLCPRIK